MELPVKVKLEIPDSYDHQRRFDFPSSQGSVSTATACSGGAMSAGITIKEEPLSPVRTDVADEARMPVRDNAWQYSNVESNSSFSNSSSSLSAGKFPPRGVRKKRRANGRKQLISRLVAQLCQRNNKSTVRVPTDLCKILRHLVRDADNDNIMVKFLIGQLHGYCCKRPKSSEFNIMCCLSLYLKSLKSYSDIRKRDLLSLPSPNTLKRYVGYTSIENEMPSAVQQRLSMKVRGLHPDERDATLIIEGTMVKVSARRNLVGWLDNIFGKVNAKFGSSTEKLPLYLLGFSLQGLSLKYVIPVAFYLMNEPTSSLIHIYLLHVLRCTEKMGIRVVRLQGSDTKECYNALRAICGGRLKARIPHFLDSSQPLFVTFDPSAVIKSVRSCFLNDRLHLVNNGKAITANPLKDFYLEQKNRKSEQKRFPTRKHLFPTDSEKTNLGRAVEVFSACARDTLVIAAQYVEEGEVEATVKFMTFMEKWFWVHSILLSDKSSYSDERHSSVLTDDSIIWLVNDFLGYLETWRKSCSIETQFLDRETYEALVVTTRATVQWIRHLFEQGRQGILASHLPNGGLEQITAAINKIQDDASMQHIVKTEPDWDTFISSEECILPDFPVSFSDTSSTGLTPRDDVRLQESVAESLKAVPSRSLDSCSEDDDDSAKNMRTARKTNSDMSLLKLYLGTVKEGREIRDIPVSELDEHLCQFIWSVRRKDGQEFEPHSLRCILGSVDRYLTSRNYGHTIFRDGVNTKFMKTKDALARKQSELRKKGRGNKPARAKTLKDEEVDRLYASGMLSLNSAPALLNTVFFYNNVHFGLKIKDHYQLLWGDIKLLKDSEGREYLECLKKSTSKGQKKKGGRPVKSHIYCNVENLDRDPIAAYKAYASHRPPPVLSPESPFYLSLNCYIYPSVTPWYRPVKMGLHKITQMQQTINQNAGPGSEKRFTNQQ